MENTDKALEKAELRKNYCLSWLYPENTQTRLDNWNYEEIQEKLLNNSTVAIDWHISPISLTTFILINNREPDCFYIKRNKLDKFIKCIEKWKKSYNKYEIVQNKEKQEQEPRKISMKKMLDEFAEILEIKKILNIINEKGANQIILIPHRDLHLLPLHVLFYSPYTEKNFNITYLPSAQSGLILDNSISKTDRVSEKSLVCVENPYSQKKPHPTNKSDKLLFAEIEAFVISELFPNTKRIEGEDASLNEVINSLKTNSDYFHFTGHAKHEIGKPSESALQLANKDKLMMKDLLKEFPERNLASYRIVSLSACETGISGKKEKLIDEFVGLASGFLYAGVSYVVSTLWRVNEVPSALLMIRFYQNIDQKKDPPAALKEAQQWLRQLTYQDVSDLYNSIADQLKDKGERGTEVEFRPFADKLLDEFNSEELKTIDNLRISAKNLLMQKNLYSKLLPKWKLFFELILIAQWIVNEIDLIKFNCPYSNIEYWGGFIITGSTNN